MEFATDTDAATQKINMKMLNAGCWMSSVKRLMMDIECMFGFCISVTYGKFGFDVDTAKVIRHAPYVIGFLVGEGTSPLQFRGSGGAPRRKLLCQTRP